MRVLLIDDDPLFLELSKTFLEVFHDIASDAVDSAGEALQKLEKDSYDVVISDYDMPFMNGIAFLKTIRNKNIKTPFILFTGADKDKIICQAMENGVSSYIQKNGDLRALYSELSTQIWQIINSYASY
ncbi:MULTISPECIES: response regulator [Methanosarcina]|uniref:Response regulator receiver protein n=1 Tax=Methanosarcina mazei TaxID=2209 RepID=A0A0F8DUE6_METMZ|nr:response regulator [Methanosarcina mazei]KKG06268.1 response regulator receiver protein [Methanosarcina mazei]KKH90535.1 response regulator receiver protein [Methanosarcina mazei]BBL64197.1 response regulator [Methanosarcina mazei]